jgi:predicted acylesterase/phospholipase RssA
MQKNNASASLAIASSAGGFKGVFVHGVLSALEAAGIRAGAYAAASASVFPSISAAIGQANEIGLKYWRVALRALEQPGNGMSESVLQSIAASGHILRNETFLPGITLFHRNQLCDNYRRGATGTGRWSQAAWPSLAPAGRSRRPQLGSPALASIFIRY